MNAIKFIFEVIGWILTAIIVIPLIIPAIIVMGFIKAASK